jgi:hypothetical protein
MHRLKRTAPARRRVVTSLEVDVIEIRVARGTSNEIELSRRGGNDSITFQAPVNRCGRGAKGQGFVGGRCCVVKVEVERAPAVVIQGD